MKQIGCFERVGCIWTFGMLLDGFSCFGTFLTSGTIFIGGAIFEGMPLCKKLNVYIDALPCFACGASCFTGPELRSHTNGGEAYSKILPKTVKCLQDWP